MKTLKDFGFEEKCVHVWSGNHRCMKCDIYQWAVPDAA